MTNFFNLLGEWARSRHATPAWAVALEALTLQQFAAPALPPLPALGRGFAAIRDAACADLLRRFADPVRVVDVDGVRIVNVLDAVVYIHDRTQRRVSVAAWQPDGTLVINTISRFEIGRPLSAFDWLDILYGQWHEGWPQFAQAMGRGTLRRRLHNALVRWMRQTVDLPAQRSVIREALDLDERMVWMTQQLGRNHRKAWLFADRYNAVGEHYQRLEWALRDSPALFRLSGLALLDGRLRDPDEPVASTRHALRLAGVSDAAWRLACRAGPRLFDAVIDNAADNRLLDACIAMLRLVEHTDFEAPPRVLLETIFRQFARPRSDQVRFERDWCDLPSWFLCHAARAARDAEAHDAIELFIDDEFLPAVEWVTDVWPEPDSNQLHAGWRWIQNARTDWYYDPGRRWAGSSLQWSCPIGVTAAEGFNIFSLTGAQEVVEEGRAMFHCVARYIGQCARGDSRLFSLRDSLTGERVATALLQRVRAERWNLVDVRGRRNALAGAAAQRAGLWLQQHCSAMTAQLPKAA